MKQETKLHKCSWKEIGMVSDKVLFQCEHCMSVKFDVFEDEDIFDLSGDDNNAV